ncbi:unnamed protein product [Lactuca virosa]|uniref:Uncharacterized protein n=1 Tax=Lactuca virosa TaxID=75947 RepID=A0AAU9PFL0_9ASTR|nr:unnamed protein product [Lactuca virosa]
MTKTTQLIHNNYKGISFVPMLLVQFKHINDTASLLPTIIYRYQFCCYARSNAYIADMFVEIALHKEI